MAKKTPDKKVAQSLPDPVLARLGERYRDTITGFEGTAVGITEYLFGCKHVMIEGPINSDTGRMNNIHSFDEPRLMHIETGAPVLATTNTGGPPVEAIHH